MAYLHSNNTIHRDLKCANLLISDRFIVKGRIKLINLQFL